MNWLLDKLGVTTDSVLASALTKLVFLALVGWAAFHFAGKKLNESFWIGFGLATAVALYLMTRVVNPVNGDPVFTVPDGNGGTRPGNLTDAATAGGNVVHGQISQSAWDSFINGGS